MPRRVVLGKLVAVDLNDVHPCTFGRQVEVVASHSPSNATSSMKRSLMIDDR
jgi:hypothetical protein